ncbi:MAG: isochorismatase family protein [Synergistaceae bacterium]|nr:isochorismatase family protein [Synergistaceae bacterium]
MGRAKLEFLIIDPQNDFCDPRGSLFVPGAEDDSIRLARTIKRLRNKIDNIHVTLDTHHWVDIAHPIFWIDQNGRHPEPFTIITEEDLKNRVWRTTNPDYIYRAVSYTENLEKNNRYSLCVWPPHCLIGSWGHNIVDPVYDALLEWENDFKIVDYIVKGANIWTEHYSAVKADVEDPDDLGTGLNIKLIKALENADVIAVSGQALSHCVANSIRDIADNFNNKDSIRKIVLLTDTTSSVEGFEILGKNFIDEMTARGMQICKADDFM